MTTSVVTNRKVFTTFVHNMPRTYVEVEKKHALSMPHQLRLQIFDWLRFLITFRSSNLLYPKKAGTSKESSLAAQYCLFWPWHISLSFHKHSLLKHFTSYWFSSYRALDCEWCEVNRVMSQSHSLFAAISVCSSTLSTWRFKTDCSEAPNKQGRGAGT